MTMTDARFDRELPALLEDLYLGPTPTYRDEVLAVATHRRQRPAWAFPGRWLPVIDRAVRPVPAARLPLRAVGAAILIVALLLAVLAFVGSRSRVPPPFGVAGNGLVAWALDGDIFVGDVTTGNVKRVVASDDLDRNPVFSRDGARIAFLRQVPDQTGHFDLVVTRPDGSAPKQLSAAPIHMPEQVEWAPDNRSILVSDADHRVTQLFLDGSPPKVLLEGAVIEPDAFRPQEGRELLYHRDGDLGTLYVMEADGTDPRQLFGPRTAACDCVTGPGRWSPDGSSVAVQVGVNNTSWHLWIIDAVTGAGRRATNESDDWMENDPAWSPDGTRIAFNRWQRVGDDWENAATGLVDRHGGPVVSLGVAPSTDGGVLEWSPDATSILVLPVTVNEGFKWSPGAPGTIARPTLIDVSTSATRQLDWSVGSASSWQRQ